MNAEVLTGTVLGTCTLQKVIGRGGMGAVFLAQQSRPRRQVAVKVLLPVTTLQPSQQKAFLERFRRETDAAASLAHPNILPVHEYGERDGLAYLVMPYISGGTLRDELEAEGKLPFTRIVSYLDQMAAALDFAHDRGIIHRDVKPANFLITPEKRLMLTDFGLVKIATGGQASQKPLSETGMPMGTPDYMAPEQVIGSEIDPRADIYALGIILYQMVTGTVPFKGEMPMKVALQHLNTLPPSPRSLRPDLPLEAEQVILRALAKRPLDRYMFAHDLANAFRQALQVAGVQVGETMGTTAGKDEYAGNRPRGLFDPVWQGNAGASEKTTNQGGGNRPLIGDAVPAGRGALDALQNMITRTDMLPETNTPAGVSTPTQSGTHTHHTSRLSKKQLVAHSERNQAKEAGQSGTDRQTPASTPSAAPRQPKRFPAFTLTPTPPTREVHPQAETTDQTAKIDSPIFQFSPSEPTASEAYDPHNATTPVQAIPYDLPAAPQTANGFSPPAKNAEGATQGGRPATAPLPGNQPDKHGGLITRQLGSAALSADGGPQPRTTRQLGQSTGMLPAPSPTGTLQHPVGEYSGDTGMLRLHQPVKVVKVPVAGQPGQYMTGILPVLPRTQTAALPPPSPAPVGANTSLKSKAKQHRKTITLVAAVLIILFATGIYALTRSAPTTQTNVKRSTGAANAAGTASASSLQATATARINATATAEEVNLILDDPLNENFHNWLQGDMQGRHYEFKNGAYHIRNDDSVLTLAALFNLGVPAKYSYSLTMRPIAGNEDSPFNFYGVVLRYSVDKNQVPTFYFFNIINNKDQSKYQFRRYDGHKPKDQNPWVATTFEHATGDEFHKGNQPNTVKVIVDGNHFTFIVNGKQVGDARDDVYKETGTIGMGVNQKGSEVAFTNFRLVRL